MRKHSILRRVIATGVSALMIGVATAQSPPAYPYAVGEPHPELSALDQSNQPFLLSDQAGKVVVLHFCATWCIPCRQSVTNEGALIANLNVQIGAENWVFINALFQDNSFNPSTAATAIAWKNFGNTPARTLHAEGNASSALALLGEQLVGVPTYVVIDTEGRISTFFTGYTPGQTEAQITSEVIEAWGSRPTTAPSPSSFSPGAPQLSAGDIVADTALDPSGGVVSASERYTLKPGYVGQLYDVVSLSIPANPTAVPEESTRPLAARAVMDDETLINLDTNTVAWSVLSGPVSSITPDDTALTGSVYKNTIATVQADAFGLSEELSFTVLDAIPDNFGPVAGDGIEDNWQFQFFDADENGELDGLEAANAAPDANPDNDLSNNFIEWAGGFDPLNPLDYLQFEILSKQPNQTRFRISKVREGTTYFVQKSTDLNFAAAPDPILLSSEALGATPFTFLASGIERTNLIVEDNSATEDSAFYRLVLIRDIF